MAALLRPRGYPLSLLNPWSHVASNVHLCLLTYNPVNKRVYLIIILSFVILKIPNVPANMTRTNVVVNIKEKRPPPCLSNNTEHDLQAASTERHTAGIATPIYTPGQIKSPCHDLKGSYITSTVKQSCSVQCFIRAASKPAWCSLSTAPAHAVASRTALNNASRRMPKYVQILISLISPQYIAIQ